jgi:hypothetical protein
MTVIWALAGACAAASALIALWRHGRRRVLACDAAMALVLLGTATLWCTSQLTRNDYEVAFICRCWCWPSCWGWPRPMARGGSNASCRWWRWRWGR